MTVLILLAGLTLGMYQYEPSWFDTRIHYYTQTYDTKEQCQAVKAEVLFPEVNKNGAVCTDNNALYLTH